MDLRQMEYLVALADEGQFTRAAAVCRVSQSGLSAAIRTLEDELGTTLFLRTTRKVEPTDAGLALLPFARQMLAQATAGRDAVVRASRELSGRLRVGAEQCLGIVDVPTLLERFRRRYPQVDIHFVQTGSHDLVAQVREGDLDVAFVATTDHLGAVARTELGRRRLVLLCPPEHPLAASSRIEWADLRDEDFIDFQESWAVRSLNDEAAAAHGLGRRVRCTVNDVHTLLDLVQRGLGVALVPQHVAAKPQAAGLASVQLPASSTPEWVVSAVTAAAPAASAPLLLEILDSELRGDEQRAA
ncbi:LysR family transcriptional regulator [Agromyces protaetiae]|uniref:LysR family transcriptional regulator n=1 Tax=Agromyces protaetiae TaxID=2509455 RepID=A0A4V0YGQ1_9MICO|nr:LysR family transcriptional regulator [Agromyces protaetiae]QAY71991.1 LysR family transcriptional regulator [Agromyces protaetiae]